MRILLCLIVLIGMVEKTTRSIRVTQSTTYWSYGHQYDYTITTNFAYNKDTVFVNQPAKKAAVHCKDNIVTKVIYLVVHSSINPPNKKSRGL